MGESISSSGGSSNSVGTSTPGEVPPGSLNGTHFDPTPDIPVPRSVIDVADDPDSAIAGLRTLGSGSQQAAPGNDPRFSTIGAQPGDHYKVKKATGRWVSMPYSRMSTVNIADQTTSITTAAQTGGKLQHLGGAVGAAAQGDLNNVIYLGGFELPSGLIDGVAMDQRTAGPAGSVWNMLLYNADGVNYEDEPGTLLWSGSVPADGANGSKFIEGLSIPWDGGLFYAGLLLQGQPAGAQARARAYENAVFSPTAVVPLTTPQNGYYQTGVVGAVPDPFVVNGYLPSVPYMPIRFV